LWKRGATLAQTKVDNKKTEQDDKETDDTTQRMEEERKKVLEHILDKEVQEISILNLHTTTVQRNDSCKDCNINNVAATAVQAQLEERSDEFESEWREKTTDKEKNWNQKREAIEREHREAIAEEAVLQASLVVHKTDKAKQEFTKIKKEIATATCNLQEIRSRSENLTKQMNEVKMLKKEMSEEAKTLVEGLKIVARSKATQLNKVTQRS
jgi:hypothetical protein